MKKQTPRLGKIKRIQLISGVITITPVDTRWYELAKDFECAVTLDDGTILLYKAKKGFRFDARSGGWLADLVEPNLGDQKHLLCWLIHDIGAYGQYLSCEEINELLRQMLIWAGDSKFTAATVKFAVGVSTSWYGEPASDSKEYPNLALITVRHFARLGDM